MSSILTELTYKETIEIHRGWMGTLEYLQMEKPIW